MPPRLYGTKQCKRSLPLQLPEMQNLSGGTKYKCAVVVVQILSFPSVKRGKITLSVTKSTVSIIYTVTG
jgi:hypothetical protein